MENMPRGTYVEDMISLLNPTWERAVEWTSWDFETASGPRVEVKQAAAKQMASKRP